LRTVKEVHTMKASREDFELLVYGGDRGEAPASRPWSWPPSRITSWQWSGPDWWAQFPSIEATLSSRLPHLALPAPGRWFR